MKKPSLISRVLATFGYAKVPKEAVRLSLWVESRMEYMLDNLKSEPGKKFYSELLTAQRELTKLLQSGRMLSKD
jgi:hypothetical protein